jgi:predicted GTPase
MIKNFEFETQPLSDYEINKLLPLFILGLKTKIGKASSVTNSQIVTALKKQGYKIDSARVRKIINHIRVKGLVHGLIATNDGYYIATTEKELAEYEESLKGREDAIRAVRLSLSSQRKQMFPEVQRQMSMSFQP